MQCPGERLEKQAGHLGLWREKVFSGETPREEDRCDPWVVWVEGEGKE